MRYLILLSILVAAVLTSCSDRVKTNETSESLKAELDSMLLSGISATRNLEFEKAQTIFNQLIEDAEAIGSEYHIITGYINLGNLYNYYSLYDQALENLFTALEKSDQFGVEQHKNAILNNIGIVYAKNGSSEKASEYFARALNKSKLDTDSNRIALNLINLSSALSDRNLNDSALSCLEEALVLFNKDKQSTNYVATLNNIGNIHFGEGNVDSALNYYAESYRLKSENIEPWLGYEFALNLARVHSQKNNLDSAGIYLDEAINGLKKVNDNENLIEAYKLESELLAKKGRSAESIQSAMLAMQVQDSIQDAKAKDWISKYQLNYEFGKKEKELELVEEEAKRKQVLWILGATGLAVILALVWLLMRSRVARLNQKNLLLEKEANLSQLSLEKNIADQKRMEEEHEAREKINMIEKEKLQQELDFKNRMLMSKVMSVSNQNEQMSEVVSLINQAEDLPPDELHQALANAKSLIKNQINLENEWESVKVHFEEVHPEFFTRLSNYNSNLNSSDLRMCAYLVLDLTSKEISNILNITPASIRKRRQRLKEKLNLESEIDLSEWLRRNILNPGSPA